MTSTACAWLQCEANPKISVIVALLLAICKILWELSHLVPVLSYSSTASFQCLSIRSQCCGSDSSTFAENLMGSSIMLVTSTIFPDKAKSANSSTLILTFLTFTLAV